ncbi:MAG: serine/threonine-protein kinase [Eubacteriales bacterium]|nr:serine/threonine-protein kinase [Eubacteriales bacterium]
MDDHNTLRLCEKDYIPSPHHLPPGTVLRGRYEVGCVLGEGGFGITYLGFDRILALVVAIKEYFPVQRCTRNAGAGNDVIVLKGLSAQNYNRGRQEYLREARILAKMEKQPAVVDVRDYFEENNTAYLVMEYIEGITLTEYVEAEEKENRLIRIDRLLFLFNPVFNALAVMHQNGILHRDICPDNLILEGLPVPGTKDQGACQSEPAPEESSVVPVFRLRLIDFGCAREAATLKETQTITLRHGYAPIEQYQHGGGQGAWTDIYALCATLYYCMTGVVPPMATNRIIKDSIQLPTTLNREITPAQETALMKGLQVRPHRRYRSISDLQEILWSEFFRKNPEESHAGIHCRFFGGAADGIGIVLRP